MRELLIVLLIAAVVYLAYDDYYKQRPALEQAQAEIQQLRQSSAPSGSSYVPASPPRRPAWFQKKVNQGSSLDTSREHTQHGERASTPQP
jgi:hypothetical protein